MPANYTSAEIKKLMPDYPEPDHIKNPPKPGLTYFERLAAVTPEMREMQRRQEAEKAAAKPSTVDMLDAILDLQARVAKLETGRA